LFENYREEQPAYFSNHGIMPIAQMIFLRRADVKADLDIRALVTTAFAAAKNIAL
jgi:hypothetical protein